ncbi:response regulator receiver domain-containing protein [Pseudomonas sp. URMO17WK12:I10]|uniref:response regulator transcription factor n=1 Tax=unclassified Pseudomonas TaxID=196821 RepID=UPI00047F4028|nr:MULTISPECIES: response regulator transcription factor [unclassified Pseudomonas]RDL24320.1 response regulator receiver domain-containing protein [Pseudomonas sp. LAMO17WK12:I3]RED11538.1 response regulator receiver domain-containing protein [Pseudomonas sp. URMO17WK12:I10]SOD05242.1 Response regulators consisting of a CheY-like receiver domain and a winged-helix DNA-binding domain [Pseudomonas sp. URMO17WK12:I9]
MQQPHVLIHQVRPSHQILLHQALNAQGVFRVRVCQDKAELDACLSGAFFPDLLIFDHAMPTRTGIAILKRLPLACPVLFVGQAGARRRNLADQARGFGLQVIAELPWPLSSPALQRVLQILPSPSERERSQPINALTAHSTA